MEFCLNVEAILRNDLQTSASGLVTLPEKAASGLPVPCGYRLLIRMYKMPEKTTGGIYLPEKDKALHDTASIAAQVVAVGSEAYRHPTKFTAGPWAKVGDWVILRKYAGTRMKVGDDEYRLVNDEEVEAVVADPASVERV